MTRILLNSILLYFVYLIIDVNGLVGGKITSITKYPFQVSIRFNNIHICGGCIIDQWHILTTASCVTSDVNVVFGNLKVLSGTGDRENRHNYGTIHDVSLVIIHDKYSPRQLWANDISILKLTSNLVFTQSRDLINLPVYSNHRSTNIIGWEGLTADNMHLIELNCVILSDTKCVNYFESQVIHDGQSCIKTKMPSHRIIQGDSGNPVITHTNKYLIGIASVIFLQPNYPSIMTKIHNYYDTWLLQMLEKY